MADLQHWLASIHRGDRAAFEALYEHMKRPLFTVILRTTGDRPLAEDVLQDLFLKLYLTPPQPAKNPHAYLCRMARNLAIDALRTQKPDIEFDEHVHHNPGPDFSQALDVEDAIAALPAREREIVTLHLNGGLKFREIAAAMDIPLGTVLWAYQKALDQLRITLGGVL